MGEAESRVPEIESRDGIDNYFGPTCPGCTNGFGVALMRQFRDGIMTLTPLGQARLAKYTEHNAEVLAIFEQDPETARLAGSTINHFLGGLQFLLYHDPTAENTVLDAGRIQQIQTLVDRISARASNGLKADLASFMVDLRAQQNKPVATAVAGMLGLAFGG